MSMAEMREILSIRKMPILDVNWPPSLDEGDIEGSVWMDDFRANERRVQNEYDEAS